RWRSRGEEPIVVSVARQTRIAPSVCPVKRALPSGAKHAAHPTSFGSLRAAASVPEARLQNFNVRSLHAVATVRPSGENATQSIWSLFPRSVATICFVATFHTRTGSPPLEAKSRPSGEKARGPV